MKDYYLLLGIDRDADKNQIKKAYRSSAKKLHPDMDNPQADEKQFKEVTEAYETLRDHHKRKEYDKQYLKSKATPSFTATDPLRRQDSCEPFNPFPFSQQSPWLQQRKKHLHYPVRLNREEIKKDVAYPCRIAILKPCPRCSGMVPGVFFLCPCCHGRRYLTTEKELVINIPKGIEDGTRVELDLDHVGIEDASLVVTVSVF